MERRNHREHIAIIGLGLIGGSMALALRQTESPSLHLTAYDTQQPSLDYAVRHGIIDIAADTLSTAVQHADIVLLAVPPGNMEETLRGIAPHLKAGAIVTDSCSVKQSVMELATQLLPPDAAFVPAHPIAGKARGGIEEAEAGLFQGKQVILTTASASPQTKQVETLWRRMGAQPESMDAATHDRLYAYISHLPQLLAFAVKATRLPEQAKGALSAFLRLTGSDSGLWADILWMNRRFVLEALGTYREALETTLTPLSSQESGQPARPAPDTDLAFAYAVTAPLTAMIAGMGGSGGIASWEAFAGSGYRDFTAPARISQDRRDLPSPAMLHCTMYMECLTGIEHILRHGNRNQLETRLSA